ncbi:ScbA/BarX family gamma-butyrolactone biosynthesis protein [Streptomyces sp. NPDC002835]|jgi:hypothetical protein
MSYLAQKSHEHRTVAVKTCTNGVAASAPYPRLTTTVPREYVHRAAVSEVLLTGWESDELAGTEHREGFTVKAQWPRSHSLFAREGVYQDPMLLIESVRQVGSLLAHAEFGVPFGYQFLMWDISIAAEPELFVADAVPTEIELRTVCRDIVRRGSSLTGMRYDVEVLRDGRTLATAGAAFRCMSPAVHRRLRGERATTTDRTVPPAVAAALVGHASARHVVLAEPAPGAGNRWELRIDTAHPTYFDHPVDHVPGMVLLEAARQAAHAVTGMPDALVVGVTSNFECYAELNAPCWITAHLERRDADGGAVVRVEGVQQEEAVFTAELTLRPSPR